MIEKMAGAITSTVNRINAVENRLNEIEDHLRSRGIITESLPELNKSSGEMKTPTIPQNRLKPPIIVNRYDDHIAPDCN